MLDFKQFLAAKPPGPNTGEGLSLQHKHGENNIQ